MKYMGSFFHCRRHRETLCLAACGVVSRGEAAAFWAHLESCPACQRRFDEVARLTRRGHALAAETLEVAPSPFLSARWETRLREQTPQSPQTTGQPAADVGALALRPAWAGLALLWVLIALLRVSAPTIERDTSTEPLPDWRSAMIALGVPVSAGTRGTDSARRPSAPAAETPAKPLGEYDPRLRAAGLTPA